MRDHSHALAMSWFRTPAGRRYYRQFAALLVAKAALLAVLYFVFIAPQPHAETSSAAVFSAVIGPSAQKVAAP